MEASFVISFFSCDFLVKRYPFQQLYLRHTGLLFLGFVSHVKVLNICLILNLYYVAYQNFIIYTDITLYYNWSKFPWYLIKWIKIPLLNVNIYGSMYHILLQYLKVFYLQLLLRFCQDIKRMFSLLFFLFIKCMQQNVIMYQIFQCFHIIW